MDDSNLINNKSNAIKPDPLGIESALAVTHELRTPLSSIRSLAEIVYDTPELDLEKRQQFLEIMIKECDRLSIFIGYTLKSLDYEGRIHK